MKKYYFWKMSYILYMMKIYIFDFAIFIYVIMQNSIDTQIQSFYNNIKIDLSSMIHPNYCCRHGERSNMREKGLLTISEFAKLRGVTTETLRYYDRIGLLKPVYIDEQTRYRYYSVLQYEQIGTIKELRQLGFSIESIAEYFRERNVSKSIEMLERKHQEILSQLEDLQHLEGILNNKLDYLHQICMPHEELKSRLIELPERYYITNGTIVNDDEQLGMSYSLLEKRLSELSPILATNRMGYYLPLSHSQKLGNEYIPFIFDASNSAPQEFRRSFPAGKYVTIFSSDGFSQERYQQSFSIMTEFMKEHQLTPAADYVICYFPVDLTITDEAKEFAFEIQLYVKEKEDLSQE